MKIKLTNKSEYKFHRQYKKHVSRCSFFNFNLLTSIDIKSNMISLLLVFPYFQNSKRIGYMMHKLCQKSIWFS